MEENVISRVVLTPDGKKKLEDELNELKTVKRVEVAKDIEAARSFGDLSENAEYDEAKNEQARIESRIKSIEEMLRFGEVVDQSDNQKGIAGVGSVVKVFDLDYDEEDIYKLVGATEADPSKLFVSTESPIGKALMGARIGETVEAQTPGGIIRMRVEEVTH